jgi:RHS repeat-associated protein
MDQDCRIRDPRSFFGVRLACWEVGVVGFRRGRRLRARLGAGVMLVAVLVSGLPLLDVLLPAEPAAASPSELVVSGASTTTPVVVSSPGDTWHVMMGTVSSVQKLYVRGPSQSWQAIATPDSSHALAYVAVSDAGEVYGITEYCCVNSQNQTDVWRYQSGAWNKAASYSSAGNGYMFLGTSGSELITMEATSGTMRYSTNDGVSWSTGGNINTFAGFGESTRLQGFAIVGNEFHVRWRDQAHGCPPFYARWNLTTHQQETVQTAPIVVDNTQICLNYQSNQVFLSYGSSLYLVDTSSALETRVQVSTDAGLNWSTIAGSLIGPGSAGAPFAYAMTPTGQLQLWGTVHTSSSVDVRTANFTLPSGGWSASTVVKSFPVGTSTSMWGLPDQAVSGTTINASSLFASVPGSSGYDYYWLRDGTTVTDPPVTSFRQSSPKLLNSSTTPIVEASPQRLFEAAIVTVGGVEEVVWSSDGANWNQIPVPAAPGHMTDVGVDDIGTVYLLGPGDGAGASWLWRLDSGRWSGPINIQHTGLNTGPARLIVAGTVPSTGKTILFAMNTSGSPIAYSNDAGTTWALGANAVAPTSSWAIVGNYLETRKSNTADFGRYDLTTMTNATSGKPVEVDFSLKHQLVAAPNDNTDVWELDPADGNTKLSVNHSTDAGATWTTTESSLTYPSSLGGGPSFTIAGDGKLYAFGATYSNGKATLMRGVRTLSDPNSWTTTLLAVVPADSQYDFETLAHSAVAFPSAPPDSWFWVAKNGGNDVYHFGKIGGPYAVPVGGPVTWQETLGLCACASRLAQRFATSRPVNTATGNFWHTFDDLSIPGRGPALSLRRTYNSLDTARNGWFGSGWTSSYDMALIVSPGSVEVAQENGSRITFTQNLDGTYSAPPRDFATLVANGDGTWTFTRRSQQIFKFDTTGRLTSERDLNGYTTTLTYPGSQTVVTDPAGRTLTFTFTSGHVTGVSDSASPARTLTYTYDGSGNLTDVIDAGGGHWQFTYDGSHRMLTMREPKYFGDTTTTPTPVTTNHYDAQGRVDWQSDPLGRTTGFDYTTVPGSTIVTDPKGNQTKFDYAYGVLVGKTAGYGSSQAATTSYVYDPATTGTIKTTDPNGHESYAGYDAAGNVVATTDALLRTTSAAYNGLNEPLTQTDRKNITTTNTFDAAGNLLTSSTPWVEGPPNTNQVTTNHYDDPTHPGDVTSMTDPRGKTWLYTYDSYGNRSSVTDPLGDKMIDCFDAIGRKTATISPRGVASGVTCATAPPAAYTTYFTYNAYGDQLTSTDPLGHQTQKTFDANRNPKTSVDADNNTTTFSYDPANELTQTQRPDLTLLKTDYWPDSTVNHQYDAANHATTYTYDSLARVSTVTDPLNRTATFGYDAAGNRTSKQDPGGNCAGAPTTGCTTYTFDAANQLTAVTYSDGTTPNVSNITYDNEGQRTGMTDGAGTWTFTWDSLHRMTSSTSGSKSVTYGWDLNGHLTSIAYPNNAGTVNRTFDDAGRLQTVSDWLSHTTTFGYDADSNLTTQTYPNSTTATETFDSAERLMSISHAPTATPTSTFASFSYGRDNANQLTSVSSTGVPTDNHTWGYSTLNQVTTDTAASNPYGYDPADNLTQQQNGARQSFDAANELIASGNISLVGARGNGDLGTTNSLTVTLPSGVAANDQILVAVTTAATNTVTAPSGSGFSLIGTKATGTSGADTAVTLFRKTAAGGETSAAFNFGSLGPRAAVAAVYRGVDPVTPVDSPGTGAAFSNTLPIQAVTPSLPVSQLVAFAGAGATLASAQWAAPAGMTKQLDQAGGATIDAAVFDQQLTGAQATGSRTATFGANGQLAGIMLTLRPATTYTYDTRGNRTARSISGTTTSYGFDQANRLTSYTAGGSTTTYGYSADNLRISKTVSGTTTPQTWNLAEGLPTLLADGTTYYVYGPGGLPLEQISGSTVLYYHHDQLGSTRAVTNSSGTVVATYSYDPYGNVAGSTGSVANPFQFAGQYKDAESGLLYLRARFYEPATGVFISRDPIESITHQPYSYANNNPFTYSDPSGLLFGIDNLIGAAIGAVGGGLGSAASQLITTGGINWAKVGIAAAAGGAAGAVFTTCGACAGAAAGAVYDFAGQMYDKKTLNPAEVNLAQTLLAMAVGGASGAAFNLPFRLNEVMRIATSNTERAVWGIFAGAIAGGADPTEAFMKLLSDPAYAAALC